MKLSSPRDLLELLSFAGACAGSVSEEVGLARGVLQGGDPFLAEQHSQKAAVVCNASLGALLRPGRWVLDLTSAVLLWERKPESRSGRIY